MWTLLPFILVVVLLGELMVAGFLANKYLRLSHDRDGEAEIWKNCRKPAESLARVNK